VRGEKIIARLASGFVVLLAKPEFYSHLASWLDRTPVNCFYWNISFLEKASISYVKKIHSLAPFQDQANSNTFGFPIIVSYCMYKPYCINLYNTKTWQKLLWKFLLHM
jgi:hypothetical protein